MPFGLGGSTRIFTVLTGLDGTVDFLMKGESSPSLLNFLTAAAALRLSWTFRLATLVAPSQSPSHWMSVWHSVSSVAAAGLVDCSFVCVLLSLRWLRWYSTVTQAAYPLASAMAHKSASVNSKADSVMSRVERGRN